MRFTGKTIVITGAGTGIGAAAAQQLASEGARLVLIGRREAPLQQVARSTGGLVLAGDGASSLDWQRFMDNIHQHYGPVDALLACAGGMGQGAVAETDDATWQATIHANLDTAFVSARACLPDLRQQRGSMVLVASIASLAAGPGVCGYTTSKHALLGLMRSLARDYGPEGVRVNAVCPGWVRTPMADEEMAPLMAHYQESMEAAYRRACANVPLRRAAWPAEIAKTCAFLLSDEASIITGASVVADGGATIVDVPTLAYEGL